MQGTWKEKVGGWNHKDTKRKKQTRKHILKDKVKPLIKKFYYDDKEFEDTIRYETIIEYKADKAVYKNSGFVEYWKIEKLTKVGNQVFGDYLEPIYNRTKMDAYLENGIWYNVYTNEIINGYIEKIAFLYKEEKVFNKPKLINCGYSRNYIMCYNIFIYNKPLGEDWHNQYGFWSTKARKHVQKLVNARDRANTREYINRGDWDKDVKTHALSKSIAWEIY